MHTRRIHSWLWACVLLLWALPARATDVTLQPASQDSFISSGATGTNYGSNVALWAGSGPDGGSSGEKRALLKFDVSSIPSGSTVTAATLQLYVTSGKTNSVTLSTYKITASWQEGTVTWNNAPASETTAQSSASVSSGDVNTWKSWNLQTLVQGWVNGSVTNHGVLLKASGGSPPHNASFHSSNYTGDTTKRPKLVVTYGSGGGSTTVTLNATDDEAAASGRPDWQYGFAYGSGSNTHLGGLFVGYAGASDPAGIGRSFLKFSLSGIPAGKTITDAKLKVYLNTGVNTSASTIEAHKGQSDSWGEGTLTWNTAPAYVGSATASVSVSAKGWYTWNVTADAQAEYAGDKTLTEVLKASSETATNWKYFVEKNCWSAYQPVLEVTYQ
ncbi:MAG: DNRLRE domain-containing protein [Armatimonadetes bacterium]|nr:DNRLRE domain-containing protein [Armatimonadota bacterium]